MQIAAANRNTNTSKQNFKLLKVKISKLFAHKLYRLWSKLLLFLKRHIFLNLICEIKFWANFISKFSPDISGAPFSQGAYVRK